MSYCIYLDGWDENRGTIFDVVGNTIYTHLEDAVDALYDLSENEAEGHGLDAEWAVSEEDLPEGTTFLLYYIEETEE